MFSKIRLLVSVPLAAALLSCGGGGGGDITPPPPPVDLNAVNAITVTAPSPTLVAGATMTLTGVATNVNGTQLAGRTFTWSTSNAAIATVDGNGTVVGVAPGTVDITATIGAKSNKVTLTITPAPVPSTIAINGGNGQSAWVNTAVTVRPSVIVKDPAGAPVSDVTVTFAVTGGGSITGAVQVTNSAGIATVGSWVMGPAQGAQALTATSENLSGSPVTFAATATPLPANMRQYNVNTAGNSPYDAACGNIKLRTGEVMAETPHVTIVADISNPANGFNAADYAAFGADFESLVWPVLTQNFGTPTDIDASGRVVAFFTSAVNQLTLAGSTSFVGGFFFGRDLYPKVDPDPQFNCAGSNEAEMFYVLAPDPTGSLGLVHTTAFVRNMAIGVIGHEMQHLINASRRIYISTTATSFETVWMEEGLSHIAEELLFYEASGRTPKSNLGSFELSGATAAAAAAHIRSNLARFSLYLKDTDANSPYGNNGQLPTRGAIWSLLRYLADRGSAATITGQPCNTAQPLALALNESCRIDGAAANQFTVDGSGGSEYAIVAFADSAFLQVGASATNTIAVSNPPNPARLPAGASLTQLPGGLTLDMSFHTQLRQRTAGEIAARIPYARARYRQRSRGTARFSIGGATSRTSSSSALVEPVWSRLVNRGPVGRANLRAEFGDQWQGAIRDWAVANYVDDVVNTGEPHHTHPSWNFRSAMSILNVSPYAINTITLGAAMTTPLVDGGAAYYRFGVAASTISLVTFTVNGGTPPPNLKLVVVRTK